MPVTIGMAGGAVKRLSPSCNTRSAAPATCATRTATTVWRKVKRCFCSYRTTIATGLRTAAAGSSSGYRWTATRRCVCTAPFWRLPAPSSDCSRKRSSIWRIAACASWPKAKRLAGHRQSPMKQQWRSTTMSSAGIPFSAKNTGRCTTWSATSWKTSRSRCR